MTQRRSSTQQGGISAIVFKGTGDRFENLANKELNGAKDQAKTGRTNAILIRFQFFLVVGQFESTTSEPLGTATMFLSEDHAEKHQCAGWGPQVAV